MSPKLKCLLLQPLSLTPSALPLSVRLPFATTTNIMLGLERLLNTIADETAAAAMLQDDAQIQDLAGQILREIDFDGSGAIALDELRAGIRKLTTAVDRSERVRSR